MWRRSVLTLLGAAIVITFAGTQRGQGQRGQVQLPDGPGRDLAQANCASCHGLNQITGAAGYNKEGWAALTSTMIALPKDQAEVLNGYLATNFPEKPGRKPTIVPGNVTIKITEWMPATKNSGGITLGAYLYEPNSVDMPT